jgi:hypothetical protein
VYEWGENAADEIGRDAVAAWTEREITRAAALGGPGGGGGGDDEGDDEGGE